MNNVHNIVSDLEMRHDFANTQLNMEKFLKQLIAFWYMKNYNTIVLFLRMF